MIIQIEMQIKAEDIQYVFLFEGDQPVFGVVKAKDHDVGHFSPFFGIHAIENGWGHFRCRQFFIAAIVAVTVFGKRPGIFGDRFQKFEERFKNGGIARKTCTFLVYDGTNCNLLYFKKPFGSKLESS